MAKTVGLLEGSHYFREGLPFFVNRVSENFEAVEHRHDFIEIVYVDNGAGFQYIGPETVRVSKGDLFVLPIGVSHVFRPATSAPGQPLVVSNLLVQPKKAAAGLGDVPGFGDLRHALRLLQLLPDDVGEDRRQTDLARPAWRHFRDRDDRFGSLFRELYREFAQRKTGFPLRMYALFAELAVQLERQLEPREACSAPSPDDTIDEAIRRIERDYAEPLSVARMAENAGISERHFNRLFKAATGNTFIAYLQNRRIARGCELLAATRQTVQAVAQQCGYQDVQFFQTVFRRIVGTTPGRFRNKAAAEAAGADAEDGSGAERGN